MALIEISIPEFDVALELACASPNNITGKPIYHRDACYLHGDATTALSRAIALAADIGLRFKVFDGFQPVEAEWVLWDHSPDSNFLADPRRYPLLWGSAAGTGLMEASAA
jgi:D-alanyl-D-alanine dipeptidase